MEGEDFAVVVVDLIVVVVEVESVQSVVGFVWLDLDFVLVEVDFMEEPDFAVVAVDSFVVVMEVESVQSVVDSVWLDLDSVFVEVGFVEFKRWILWWQRWAGRIRGLYWRWRIVQNVLAVV